MANIRAIEAGRVRRVERATRKTANIEWYIENVTKKVDMTMLRRMREAVQYLQSKIVINISRPVTKTVVAQKIVVEKADKTGKIRKRKRTVKRVRVTDRSKPGEFPKADTTLLMKSIFHDIKTSPGRVNGFIGTPIDYGVILELRMGRSFLVRTLNEELATLRAMFVEPIRG